MGVNSVNDAGSAYGAAFRNKPVFFMTGKETEAFSDGKMRRNMELREDTCTLSSNNTYRRQHTTYEVSDKDKVNHSQVSRHIFVKKVREQ